MASTESTSSHGQKTESLSGYPAYPPFEYRRLSHSDSIRLILADLDTRDGCIHCRLVEIRLESIGSQATYHCLSYTWGNPYSVDPQFQVLQEDKWHEQVPVLISVPAELCQERAGCHLITKNLDAFLREFHRSPPSGVQYLWVDALCINQDDMDERAAQVRIMATIYSNCEAAIMWLGPEGNASNTALGLIDKLNQSTDEHFDDCWRKARVDNKTTYADLSRLFPLLDLTPFTPDEWLSLILFFDRAWYHRTWIIQECILPRNGTLWCGELRREITGLLTRPIRILHDYVARHASPVFKHLFNSHSSQLYSPAFQLRLHHIFYYLEPRFLSRHVKSIRAEINLARSCRCADPRDKIYALLGLQSPEESESRLAVDYRKPVSALFQEFAVTLPLEGILYSVEDPTIRRTADLPSWVPDYCVPSHPMPWRFRGGFIYRAGTLTEDERFKQFDTADPRILALSGFVEDTIAEIGATYDETVEGSGLCTSLRVLVRLVEKHPLQEDPVEAFWRTLIADLPGNGNRHPDSATHGPSFCSVAQYLISVHLCSAQTKDDHVEAVKNMVDLLNARSRAGSFPDWSSILELSQSLRRGDSADQGPLGRLLAAMAPYVSSLDRMFPCRRFFTTTKGRLGIGPVALLPGDSITILEGAHYPFLLRTASEASNKLIGHVYVRGIMDGEALGNDAFRRLEIE